MEYTVYTEKNNIRMFDTSSMNFVDSFGFLLDNFVSFPAVVPRTPWPPSSPVWVSSWRLMALCRSEVMAGPLTPIDFPQKKALFNQFISWGGVRLGGRLCWFIMSKGWPFSLRKWATRWRLSTNQLMLWEVYPWYQYDTIGNMKFLPELHKLWKDIIRIHYIDLAI